MRLIPLLLLACPALTHAGIVGISIPVNSATGGCRPRDEGVWSVSAPPYPLNISSGIGYLVNPTAPGNTDFVLHDHIYSSPHVPDASRAVVTYTFDQPTTVRYVDIRQHGNGINQIEGYYGNSVGSLASMGIANVPGAYGEHTISAFDLGNTTLTGTIFRFVVTRTHAPDGWASYRAFLRDRDGNSINPADGPLIPLPPAAGLTAAGLICFAARRRRAL